MSQVPGLGHVTVYRHPGRYPTLFHSPLVGVDKETLATSTLREKLEEEMNLGNLFSRSRSRSSGSRTRSRSLGSRTRSRSSGSHTRSRYL